MASSLAEAVSELYQAPLETFVAERKRLAAELKQAGDKASAAELAKLARPSITAWAVNQLWWQDRREFEALFRSAERLRKGDLSATNEHRAALAQLRKRAATLLEAASHATSDATMRRVTTTLSALAAAGNFAPEPPGALSADRESLGFEASGLEASLSHEPAAKPREALPKHDKRHKLEDHQQQEQERRRKQQEEAGQKRLEQERAKQKAERQRLQGELKDAERALKESVREVERLKAELGAAEKAVSKAEQARDKLEQRLRELD